MNQVATRRIPRTIDGETTHDRIQRYYAEPGTVEFSPQEEELHKRYLEAYKQLIDNHGSKVKVVLKLMELFDIDRATAYRDLRSAEDIFGKAQKLDKEAARSIANNMIAEVFALAKKKKDPIAMNRATESFIKNNGTDRDDPENPFENFQPNLFYLFLPGSDQSKEGMISVNLDKAHELPEEDQQRILERFVEVQDINFEEVE